MGRGRAKAKQTKVARQLKYGAVHSDLGALQAELSAPGHAPTPDRAVEVEPVPDEDQYQSYRDDDSDDLADEPVRRAR